MRKGRALISPSDCVALSLHQAVLRMTKQLQQSKIEERQSGSVPFAIVTNDAPAKDVITGTLSFV